MGKWVLKNVLIKWSKGLKLNIVRIIITRKKQYLNTSLNNAVYKNIKKDLKQKLNFKLSNLYRTIFRGKNGIGWDGKLKILSSYNKGTEREQFSKFNHYINNIISIIKKKKCKKRKTLKQKSNLNRRGRININYIPLC